VNIEITDKVIDDVVHERSEQDKKWGEQNHAFPMWLTILMEEVGEASQAFLSSQFGGSDDGQCGSKQEYRDHMRDCTRMELVQVAAVVFAMIECMDRTATTEGSAE